MMTMFRNVAAMISVKRVDIDTEFDLKYLHEELSEDKQVRVTKISSSSTEPWIVHSFFSIIDDNNERTTIRLGRSLIQIKVGGRTYYQVHPRRIANKYYPFELIGKQDTLFGD